MSAIMVVLVSLKSLRNRFITVGIEFNSDITVGRGSEGTHIRRKSVEFSYPVKSHFFHFLSCYIEILFIFNYLNCNISKKKKFLKYQILTVYVYSIANDPDLQISNVRIMLVSFLLRIFPEKFVRFL